MPWKVTFCDEFELEYRALDEAVQDELLAQLKVLEQFGPSLGRPQVDTLKFDPERAAIVLVGGDKSGGSQQRFYKRLIKHADQRFDRHLVAPEEGRNG